MADSATISILLGFLAHEDLSGYDLRKRVAGSVGKFWDVGYGQIYPALKEMEREGLVIAQPGFTGKGPERIAYRITAEGRKQLASWVTKPGDREHLRFEVMLKLFFGSALQPEENARRASDFGTRHQRELDEILKFKNILENVLDGGDHLYYYLTVLFGEKIHRACVEWADAARALIETKAANEGVPSDDPETIDP
jgi:DNA-binding PadR family transcriptional regulator